MMMNEDGCIQRGGSSLRLDPTYVSVLSLKHNIEALGIGVSENEEFKSRVRNMNRGIVDAHRFGRHFMSTNDARQAFSQDLLDFQNRTCRDHFRSLVVVIVTLPSHLAFFIFQDLF